MMMMMMMMKMTNHSRDMAQN